MSVNNRQRAVFADCNIEFIYIFVAVFLLCVNIFSERVFNACFRAESQRVRCGVDNEFLLFLINVIYPISVEICLGGKIRNKLRVFLNFESCRRFNVAVIPAHESLAFFGCGSGGNKNVGQFSNAVGNGNVNRDIVKLDGDFGFSPLRFEIRAFFKRCGIIECRAADLIEPSVEMLMFFNGVFERDVFFVDSSVIL